MSGIYSFVPHALKNENCLCEYTKTGEHRLQKLMLVPKNAFRYLT